MTELPENTSSLFSSPAAQQAAALLQYYSFELGDCCIDHVLTDWLERFPYTWVPLAIIEALYQGRYKTVSVEQILTIWQRREQPICHFNHEFERLVSSKFPRPFAPPPEPIPAPAPDPEVKLALSYRKMLLDLPSVRAASKLERVTEIPSLKLSLSRPELELLNPHVTSDRSSSPSPPLTTVVDEEVHVLPQPESQDSILAQSHTHNSGASSRNGSHQGRNGDSAAIDLDREFKEFKEGVAFGLSYGLVARSLKPKFKLEFSQRYQPEWVHLFPTPTSIDQFIPASDSSDFHSKLKTVAQSSE